MALIDNLNIGQTDVSFTLDTNHQYWMKATFIGDYQSDLRLNEDNGTMLAHFLTSGGQHQQCGNFRVPDDNPFHLLATGVTPLSASIDPSGNLLYAIFKQGGFEVRVVLSRGD